MWLTPFLPLGLALVPLQDVAPEHDRALVLRAADLDLANDAPAAALVRLETFIEVAPADAEAHRLLGHAQLELDRPHAARAAFSKSVQLGLLAPDTLAALATLDAGHPVARTTALEWLHFLAPDALNTTLVLAQAEAERGRLPVARRLVEGALDAAPGDATAHRMAGSMALEAGDLEAARLELATAYWLAPEPGLARTLGDLAADRGAARRALAWYARAADAPATRLRRAHLRLGLGQYAAAAALLEPLGADVAALELRGHVELAQGGPRSRERAADAWFAALEAGSRRGDLLAFVATEALAHLEAQASADEAMRARLGAVLGWYAAVRDPLDASAATLLVRGHTALGDPAAARAALVAYVEAAGFDATADGLVRILREELAGAPTPTAR